MTRRLSEQDRELMRRVMEAGGSHCFRADDHIPGAGHKALRSLAYRGLLTVEPTDDGPLVTLTAQGRAEVDDA